MADFGDLGQAVSERFLEQSMRRQRTRAAQRFEPVNIEGETCCPDCLQPLEVHRLEAGICVHCLNIREKKQKGYA